MPESSTPFYALPKQPRLIWNGRDKRRAAEPLPTQTVEVIRPFYADQQQGALDGGPRCPRPGEPPDLDQRQPGGPQ